MAIFFKQKKTLVDVVTFGESVNPDLTTLKNGIKFLDKCIESLREKNRNLSKGEQPTPERSLQFRK